jgi:hypothetical protein
MLHVERMQQGCRNAAPFFSKITGNAQVFYAYIGSKDAHVFMGEREKEMQGDKE